jgi:uncharacterized membrane protein YfcA
MIFLYAFGGAGLWWVLLAPSHHLPWQPGAMVVAAVLLFAFFGARDPQ